MSNAFAKAEVTGRLTHGRDQSSFSASKRLHFERDETHFNSSSVEVLMGRKERARTIDEQSRLERICLAN